LITNDEQSGIADAHRGDGKHYAVHADEKLAVFFELERITHELAVSALLGDDAHSSKTSQMRMVRL
jgi:hypothetical protein